MADDSNLVWKHRSLIQSSVQLPSCFRKSLGPISIFVECADSVLFQGPPLMVIYAAMSNTLLITSMFHPGYAVLQ